MFDLHPDSCVQSHEMRMPVIGLGTWQATDQQIETAINAAIDVGYRHIDTAFVYMNESAIGKALKKLFENGKVRREDLFIVTKLPNIANDAKYVEEYLKRSLVALQLDYVDLYLIHHPVGLVHGDDLLPRDANGKVKLDLNTDHVSIWKAMEAQVDAGRTKSIGLSNFNIRQIERILKSSRIPPTNIQVELHIYYQQKELRDYCKKNDITICAYAPLGSPNLVQFTEVLGGDSKSIPKLSPLLDPVVLRIAEAHEKTPAQILLRHLLQLGLAVIPKSSNPQRIQQNFEVFDFQLTENEMSELNAQDKGTNGKLFTSSILNGIEDHPEFPDK